MNCSFILNFRGDRLDAIEPTHRSHIIYDEIAFNCCTTSSSMNIMYSGVSSEVGKVIGIFYKGKPNESFSSSLWPKISIPDLVAKRKLPQGYQKRLQEADRLLCKEVKWIVKMVTIIVHSIHILWSCLATPSCIRLRCLLLFIIDNRKSIFSVFVNIGLRRWAFGSW